ncbi:MFS transporter [Agromyces laixinhei]|uniref:MFS transporter n=1 Tax=Agromyces laixinhei TaxID=2585717 RepID=UPI001E2BB713|nr:MFS transporter [Agromyces laixinhei]
MNHSGPSTSLPVWRERGMPALLILTAAGFAGYAVLLPVAPLWAVHGGADEAGSGLVNGVLLFVTILTQGFVPRLLRRFGAALVLGVGLALLGGPSLLQLLSDDLWWILTLSAVRGFGFGILTVCGSAAVAHLVSPARHGAAIGVYGAAIAVPQVLLLPIGPWLADTVGFWLVFALGTLPLLGIGFAPALAHAWHGAIDTPEHHGDGTADTTTGEGDGAGRRSWMPRGLLRPMLLLLAVTLAGGALITFAPQMVSTPAATTGGLALFTVAAAISRWGIGGPADRHGTRPFVWPLVLATSVGLVLVAFAVSDPAATLVPLFLCGMALSGVAYGGLQNLTLLLSLNAVRREEYDTASAVWNIGFDAGTGVGSMLIGSLAARLAFAPALLVAAAASLATLPLAFVRGRRSPADDGTP